MSGGLYLDLETGAGHMVTLHDPDGLPVPWIEPHKGWAIYVFWEPDGDRFVTPRYTAVRGDERRHLPVSTHWFRPTQDRFAFLVDVGFARQPDGRAWSDQTIETAIAGGAVTEGIQERSVEFARKAARAQLATEFALVAIILLVAGFFVLPALSMAIVR